MQQPEAITSYASILTEERVVRIRPFAQIRRVAQGVLDTRRPARQRDAGGLHL
jgi:hypothetical protein